MPYLDPMEITSQRDLLGTPVTPLRFPFGFIQQQNSRPSTYVEGPNNPIPMSDCSYFTVWIARIQNWVRSSQSSVTVLYHNWKHRCRLTINDSLAWRDIVATLKVKWRRRRLAFNRRTGHQSAWWRRHSNSVSSKCRECHHRWYWCSVSYCINLQLW